MPSVYQLLPRSRHQPLLDVNDQPVTNVFDPTLWERHGWGLADPSQDRILEILLPESPTRRSGGEWRWIINERDRAKQLTSALDFPATPPPTTRLLLVAGDSMPTMSAAQIQEDGRLKITKHAPGDGVVLRRSALMDERNEKMLGSR